jgi:hypothetical protein
MRLHALYLPALVLATLCALVVAISPFVGTFQRLLVRPLTWAAAAALAVLFLRMLFDPRCHQGIRAANRELQGDQPFRLRGPKLTDPTWGLFGSRAGPRPLLIVRAGLGAEFLAALFLSGRGGPHTLLLAAAGFGIAIMLSIIHIGLNTPVEVA